MGVEVRAAMFFAGLILLIPHRIGMSRVNYIIKRYNLPISRAGLLLYKFHNPIELSLTIGNVFGVLITFTAGNKNNSGANVLGGSMIGFTSAMFLSSIYMLRIYVSGDDFGHLNAFYITLILLTFFDGFTNAFAFGCNGANASLYAAGIPISGFLVSIFHNIYKFFFDTFHWDDFDYYVLFLQLLYNIIILLTTIIIWASIFSNTNNIDTATPPNPFDGTGDPIKITWASDDGWDKLFDSSANDGHAADWSPILLLAISLGTVYAFYPSIAPYSIIDYQYASIIELWILLISSSPTLAVAILDFFSIGPGTCAGHKTNPNSGNGNWSNYGLWSKTSKTTGDHARFRNRFYHCVWLCAIPYILCIQIFMSLLHYPDSILSSLFNNNPLRIGFISVLFNTLREAMQAVGFSGAGKQQKDDGAGGNVKGSIAATNKPITLFVMMFCVFTGDGYLQHYRRCCRDNWPTTGYNKYQSFFYWLRYGFKGGTKSFITSFTDLYHHDIRPQIISYA